MNQPVANFDPFEFETDPEYVYGLEDGPPPDPDEFNDEPDGVVTPLRSLAGPTAAEKIAGATMTTAQLKAMEPAPALVAGHLLLDSTAVIFGPTGSFKTFTALDLAAHVASGSWWWGQEVHRGPVVYVVAEGAGRFGARVEAWERHHGVTLDKYDPITWITAPVSLANWEEVGAFIDAVVPLKPVLIVFDTLARCILGVEENSAKEMGEVVAAADTIRRHTGACVLLVHHTGVAEGRQRGSTALKGALDTEIEVTATDGNVVVKVTKQKDGIEPNPRHFKAHPSGDSVVLLPGAHALGDSPNLPSGIAATLAALEEVELPGGVATGVWLDASPTPRSSFYKHVKGLAEQGYVRNIGTEKMPRYVTTRGSEAA